MSIPVEVEFQLRATFVRHVVVGYMEKQNLFPE